MEPCGRLAALGKAAATEGWSVAPFEEHRDTHLFSRRWGKGGLMLGRRASWVWEVVQCVSIKRQPERAGLWRSLRSTATPTSSAAGGGLGWGVCTQVCGCVGVGG